MKSNSWTTANRQILCDDNYFGRGFFCNNTVAIKQKKHKDHNKITTINQVHSANP